MRLKRKTLLWLALGIPLVALVIYAGHLEHDPDDDRAAAVGYAALNLSADALLVDFQDSATEDEMAALMRKYDLRLRPNSEFSAAIRLYRHKVRKPSRLARLLQRLRAEPLVQAAEMDALYSIPPLQAAATRFDSATTKPADKKKFPNDPKYKYQWHLEQIGMPRAWPKSTGKGVIVAVIDTGVAYGDRGKFKQVPDLAGTEFVPGYNFVSDSKFAHDDHGHGTHVAGTIAQSTNNGVGVAGVAYGARIMPLKVLSARGFGNVADIAEAIRFAADNGAKVINMSLGGSAPSKIMASAVSYAHKKGVIVVCAAGNDGRGRVGFPAAFPDAVAVAATQFDRSATFYSNWGKEIDLAAPGGNTRVDQNGDGMPDGVLQNTIVPGRPELNDYLLFMGTSMASPHVAGVAALVIAGGVTDPDAVEKVLKDTARHPDEKEWDPHYGAGIIDAGAALRKASASWGGYKLGLSATLGLLVLLRLRRRQTLGLRPGAGALAGLLLGSSGLFFLNGLLPPLPGPLATLLTQGLPSWDLALLGASGHGNPLFFSLLVPLGAAVMLYGVPRLRGLLFGLTVGVAGHLLFGALVNPVDVTWVPNVLCLDQAWLAINGLAGLALASVLARK